jgi:hypothetical protein
MMPFGYDMFQDPDVVKEMMDNIAKIMKRNGELYAMVGKMEQEIGQLRMELLLRGDTHS